MAPVVTEHGSEFQGLSSCTHGRSSFFCVGPTTWQSLLIHSPASTFYSKALSAQIAEKKCGYPKSTYVHIAPLKKSTTSFNHQRLTPFAHGLARPAGGFPPCTGGLRGQRLWSHRTTGFAAAEVAGERLPVDAVTARLAAQLAVTRRCWRWGHGAGSETPKIWRKTCGGWLRSVSDKMW